MTKVTEDNIVVGLDIGTSIITAVVGEILPDGQISIIGVGSAPSKGMDKGGVTDFEAVVKAVGAAISSAEFMLQQICKIKTAYISLSGVHISSRIEKGMSTISDEEVTQDDMDRVIHTAKSIKISDDQRILHVIPQEFIIDYQEGIKNPLGLSGVRMEVSVHLITCHNDMARNITKAVERCGLQIDQLVFSGLASSNAVITEDERELGVCVIDIGAGTMDVAVWTGGALRHTEVFSYAGNSVTSDIAFAFGTPLSDAENLKVNYGCVLAELVNKDENVTVPSVGGRPSRTLQRQTLAGVIGPRYTELMTLVRDSLKEVLGNLKTSGIKHQLAAGIVLTGGASQIEGLSECAERVFDNQVRVGKPHNLKGVTEHVNDPSFSTAIGLLQYAKDSQINEETDYNTPSRTNIMSWYGKFKNWFENEF